MARKSRKNITVGNTVPAAVYIRTAQAIKTGEYIRLSVEDSNNKGNSIENQKLILDDYLARNIDLQLFDRYIDNGATGTNFDRPQFQRMLADIESGKIQCVIVKDLSRLGRNAIDTGFYIEKYFASKNVRFVAVTDNFDTDNPETTGLMMHLKNVINEAYAIDIGKKIKSQARQAMRDGDYIGARPRYGYLKAPDNCHRLILDEETAPVVKLIFELFSGGMSLNEIAMQLNERKIVPPSVHKYNTGMIRASRLVGGDYWQTLTINQILHEPIYTGNMVQGKTETFAHKQKRVKDKSKWVTVENTHPAIVSVELFDAVQKRFADISEKSKSVVKKPYTENIYKGKVFCGYCGRALNRQRHFRKKSADAYRYYCVTNTRVARGICDSPSILEDRLTEAVITAIKGQTTVIAGKKKILLANASDKQKSQENEQNIKELQQYIERNQNYLRTLYENLVNNTITAAEYKAMKADYESKISDAVKKIHDIEEAQKRIQEEYERYCDLSDSAKEICKNGKLTKALIDKMIDKIYLYNDKRIEIVFTFESEYDKISEVVSNG